MTDSTPLIPEQSNKKQGHRVLCCCDSRKAAILVSLVALVLSVLALIGAAMAGNPNAVTIAVTSVSILFYFLVVWGAIRYHRCACILSLIWEIAAVVLIIIGAAATDWSSMSDEDKEA
eukprot:103957_1